MKLYILTIPNSPRLKNSEGTGTYQFWSKYVDTEIEVDHTPFPCWGRNECLKRFYASNDEWCCIVDDDCTIHLNTGNVLGKFPIHLEAEYFLNNMEEILNKLPKDVALISPMNGVRVATNIEQAEDVVHNNWCFRRAWDLGKIVFVRNMRKHMRKEFYQRTDLPYAEDAEWVYQHIKAGFWTGNIRNIVVRELGNSLLFPGDKNKENTKRLDDIEIAKHRILQLYPEFSLKNGVLQREKLIKKYLGHTKKQIVIPYTHKTTEFNKRFDKLFAPN